MNNSNNCVRQRKNLGRLFALGHQDSYGCRLDRSGPPQSLLEREGEGGKGKKCVDSRDQVAKPKYRSSMLKYQACN